MSCRVKSRIITVTIKPTTSRLLALGIPLYTIIRLIFINAPHRRCITCVFLFLLIRAVHLFLLRRILISQSKLSDVSSVSLKTRKRRKLDILWVSSLARIATFKIYDGRMIVEINASWRSLRNYVNSGLALIYKGIDVYSS